MTVEMFWKSNTTAYTDAPTPLIVFDKVLKPYSVTANLERTGNQEVYFEASVLKYDGTLDKVTSAFLTVDVQCGAVTATSALSTVSNCLS
jgi:hypothetical protein